MKKQEGALLTQRAFKDVRNTHFDSSNSMAGRVQFVKISALRAAIPIH
jgi:hypothetical protein